MTGSKNYATNRLRGFSRLEVQAESRMPFLFPTRPYSAPEIALLIPACVDGPDGEPARLWAKMVRAVRGIWVWPHLLKEGNGPEIDVLESSGEDAIGTGGPMEPPWRLIGRHSSAGPVLLGITSLYTSTDTWRAAASGQHDLSPDRYRRIAGIVEQAISARPRPTHLLLPELALPERWIDTVAGRLQTSGISLIAGLDYYAAKGGRIHSDAVLILTDDRLGYPSSVQIRQRKSQPAPHEDKDLTEMFGYSWDIDGSVKPVYEHNGFCFGVLVCSELQNISHRQRFQGCVDAVMVLAWNQDLETFSALVESAALDVHACIALANNRAYGDSRARVPAKQSFNRDLCRIRGGENDYVVVVKFDPVELRHFQSRSKNWGRDDDPFKPVPEGFRIHSRRKTIPI